MSNAPNAQSICEAVGISPSYANKIIGGHRVPPVSLAIAIYRKLGWRHQTIAKMRDDDIAVLERHNPWTPPAARERSVAA